MSIGTSSSAFVVKQSFLLFFPIDQISHLLHKDALLAYIIQILWLWFSFSVVDIGSPMEGEKQFQSETKSEEEDIDESDSEGFFDKAKDFFHDIFSSDTDEEEEGAKKDNDLRRNSSLEGGRTDSGIASLARPTAASSVAGSSNASRGNFLNRLGPIA